MKFAFWNINDKATQPLKDAIKSLSIGLDFLVLAENDCIPDSDIELLTGMKVFLQSQMSPDKRWLYLYSNEKLAKKINYRDKSVTTKEDEFPVRVSSCEGFNKYLDRYERLLLFDILLGDDNGRTDKLLLGVTHMVSKLSADEMKQRIYANKIRQTLEHTFQSDPEGYQNKCILFGDFNLNPYENIMSDPLCFRSYKSIHDSMNTSSIYGSNPFAFYNPCHYLYGEYEKDHKNHKVPGTFYFVSSIGEKWNVFDQLIFTPNSKKLIKEGSIKIVAELGGKCLLNDDHIPDNTNFSDHLPIIFELNI